MKKQKFLDPFIATAVAQSILGQAPGRISALRSQGKQALYLCSVILIQP